ncbi:MAG: hypothetical protein WC730_02335 [Patescibacteria group bacterium]|jgi:hypothetical protein
MSHLVAVRYDDINNIIAQMRKEGVSERFLGHVIEIKKYNDDGLPTRHIVTTIVGVDILAGPGTRNGVLAHEPAFVVDIIENGNQVRAFLPDRLNDRPGQWRVVRLDWPRGLII